MDQVWAIIGCDYQGHDGFSESISSLHRTLEGALADWWSSYCDLSQYPTLREDPDTNYAWILEDDDTWSLYGRNWERDPYLRIGLMEVGP